MPRRAMARQDSFAWWLKTGDGQAGGILKRHWRRRDVPIGDGNGTMTVGLFNVWKSARTCSLPLFLLFFLFSSLLRCCVFFRRDDAVVWCVFLSLSLGGLACRLSARLTGSWRGKIFFEPFSSIATVIHIRETRDTLFSIDICCVRRVRLAVRLVAVRPRDETKPNKHRFCGDNNVVSRVIASR